MTNGQSTKYKVVLLKTTRVARLGNCKDSDKRTNEAGKSEETIREIIIPDNPPGIQ